MSIPSIFLRNCYMGSSSRIFASCSTSVSSGSPIAENSCGIQPDTVSLSCRVGYSGEIAPVLVWKNIGGHNLSRNNKEGSNTVVNTVHTRATWTDFTFLCETEDTKHSCYSVIPKPLCKFIIYCVWAERSQLSLSLYLQHNTNALLCSCDRLQKRVRGNLSWQRKKNKPIPIHTSLWVKYFRSPHKTVCEMC